MYQKVMENKEDWLYDITRGREMQLRYLKGKRESYFVPDFHYAFMSAIQIKTGREIGHMRTKVNKVTIKC